MLIDGYMVETSDEKWKWNAAMRCREVDNEAMRHVKDVKSQFDTFTREILNHKEKKNGDCTGNEGDPAFKSFLDKDKSTREMETMMLKSMMGRGFQFQEWEPLVKQAADARAQRRVKNSCVSFRNVVYTETPWKGLPARVPVYAYTAFATSWRRESDSKCIIPVACLSGLCAFIGDIHDEDAIWEGVFLLCGFQAGILNESQGVYED